MFSLVYVLCGALTLVVCIFSRQIGAYLALIDEPDRKRKNHARPTPLVGGLAIIVPLVLTTAVLALEDGQFRLYGTLMLALIAYFMCGLVDDYRPQSPWLRLTVCAAAALGAITVVPLFGVKFLWFGFYDPVIGLGAGAAVFTIICIVGLTNAINMADGENGLVIGLALIWTLLLFAYAPGELHALLVVLALGLAITLVFNLKGLVFLGDSGTYGVSIALALVTIYSYNFSFPVIRADVLMLFFLIPVVDCLRIIVVRVMRHGSPFVGDRNHLHHILQRLLPEGAALAAYWSLVGVPCGSCCRSPPTRSPW